jgi:hypothetical protein
MFIVAFTKPQKRLQQQALCFPRQVCLQDVRVNKASSRNLLLKVRAVAYLERDTSTETFVPNPKHWQSKVSTRNEYIKISMPLFEHEIHISHGAFRMREYSAVGVYKRRVDLHFTCSMSNGRSKMGERGIKMARERVRKCT